uniref:Peptidase C39-like domain-containing protein n=1 Tax=Bicosoecida sp. CB-2014 TaxID=1486930 RepID=A0A7S1G6Z6_9STRA|mmetsp:Transcript_18198/g.64511  ORF Transcript_18198/g.64511 Transcript_18198/m.64511 type:complete len:419 (+) Transcript_18198:122-1378(+)
MAMVRAATVAAAIALAAAVAAASPVKPCGDWVLYKQCGESWSGHALGTSSNTICSAGCAMSSVAMSLATYHEKVGGQRPTPGTLNAWLTDNGGYDDGDLIIWNSVASQGKLHMASDSASMSPADIKAATHRCEPVIANVRDGSHWVLITGYDSDDASTFYVNDPGFDQSSYDHSGMSHFVVYSNATATTQSGTAAGGDVDVDAAAQASPALIAEAAMVGSPDGGHYGVDVSTPTSESEFACMKKDHDVSFAVARCYTENGDIDSAAVGTGKAAAAAGVSFSVYHFPCQHQDAAAQVRTSLDHLKANGISFTHYWLDIERSDWPSNTTRNAEFIMAMADAVTAAGHTVGVYTSVYSWTPITSDTHELAALPLWYPHYENTPEPNFNDFSAFGGWSSPYAKQYKGTSPLCGASVDVNWRP